MGQNSDTEGEGGRRGWSRSTIRGELRVEDEVVRGIAEAGKVEEEGFGEDEELEDEY